MNRPCFALLAAALALPLAACNFANGMTGDVVKPSGQGDTRSYQVADFTGVSLRGSDNVEIRTGAFSVTAEGDSKLLDRLEIRKDGDTLRVGRKDGDWNWGGDRGARIIVTLPALADADIAGSGDMTIDQARGDFSGSVAGSGNLTLTSLAGGKANLSIAGSGDIIVTGGTASSLDVSIAGSGDVKAAGLKANGADISIAGSGNVRAQVSGNADISLVGSGDVELTGGAKCSVSSMGSGEARCS
ncbi:head GIN domain-containing protein [Sphingomonas sp. ST-64]|uniref:Head GIN domain-containing protein n=1 Tax=Sphingomonas plantiphila TaxID=3163295 RepID=A0ABW8YMF5_9SPHN